jgi:hypothetical protein
LVRRLNALVNAPGRNRLRGAKGGTRPVVFYERRAISWYFQVKNLTITVNSIFNVPASGMSGSTSSRLGHG